MAADDDLRKWDTEVRGNVRSGPSDASLYSAPSVTRIKNSQRSMKSDRAIDSKDIAISMVVSDPLGTSSHDGSDHYDENDAAATRYTAGRGAAPDQSFAATQLIHLTRGNTAYKIIESEGVVDDRGNSMEPITIVCLHGLMDSSYIWEDIAEVLSSSDAGPCARVVVFDFYGRGRSHSSYLSLTLLDLSLSLCLSLSLSPCLSLSLSVIRSPWSGFPCTLDVYVTQLKELLDKLGLSSSPVHLLGYCLGGAVATGFAVKFPHICKSLCLIDAAGVRLKNPAR
jgi:pimeloyl-ACP methyl ester carboxylesterase